MVLQSLSSITLTVADKKQFTAGEKHVTRLNKRESVLILMEKGVLHFFENGHLITLTAGEYYIQKKGLLQEGYLPPEENELANYVYIHFIGGSFAEKGDGLPLRGTYTPSKVANFVNILLQKKNVNNFHITGMLYMILASLADQTSNYNHAGDMLDLLKYRLETSFSEKLTLNDLAKQFGYHPVHLSRLFTKRYGTTIHQYLIDQKITRAHWLLYSTDETVEKVAEMVGYQDLSAFYRAYLARYNESPRARKQSIDSEQS